MNVRILLVDDHVITRQGLRVILEADQHFHVVGEADNGHQAIELAERLCPDVVVMDIAMPGLNGVEATRRLMALNPKLKVIALTAYTDRQFMQAILEAGGCGYVAKAAAGEELLQAIHAALNQHPQASPQAGGSSHQNGMNHPFLSQESTNHVLTPREREVLQLLAEGKPSKGIAAILRISIHTVEVHRRNIMKKLELNSIAELTKYAVREGLTFI